MVNRVCQSSMLNVVSVNIEMTQKLIVMKVCANSNVHELYINYNNSNVRVICVAEI